MANNFGNDRNRYFRTLLSTDLMFLDNNMYLYKNHLITRKKIPDKVLDRMPTLETDNIQYGWVINNGHCLFGGLTKATAFIDGII